MLWNGFSVDNIVDNLPWCCLFIAKYTLYLVSATGNGSHFQHAASEICYSAMLRMFTFPCDGLTYLSASIVMDFPKSRVSDPIFSKSQFEIKGAKSLLPLACYGNVYISYKEKHITGGWFFLGSYIVTLYFKGKVVFVLSKVSHKAVVHRMLEKHLSGL